jgi:hypothetical protein
MPLDAEEERQEKLLWQARYNTVKNTIGETLRSWNGCDEAMFILQRLANLIYRLDKEVEIPEEGHHNE